MLAQRCVFASSFMDSGSFFNISANALVRNDDCQTALDIARIKGNINIVRAIEVSLKRTQVLIY